MPVLNYDDANTAALGKGLRGQVVYFSRKATLEEGVFVREVENTRQVWPARGNHMQGQ